MERKLVKSARDGDLNEVRLLMIEGVDPSNQDNHAIKLAVVNGHIQVVKLLLPDLRVNPAAEDNYCIRIASAKGYTDIVELLLQDDRVDPSAKDNYAITIASEKGYIDIVGLLLQDPRVDPSDNNNSAIRAASSKGRLGVVRLLLQDARVDPSDNNNAAILEAIFHKRWNVVRLLAQNQGIDNDQELFYWAISKNKKYEVNILKSLPSVNPGADNNHGLLIAVSVKNQSIAGSLLEDPRVQIKGDIQVAIDYARKIRDTGMVELLTKYM